ncbi:hypothetical protein [Streptomyces xinghaiensis]|nr:hypothetical protein OG463_12630 [Streptomyces xinghaiensis]
MVIGCLCVAILACCFALRVWREIQTIKADNEQARDRREARRRKQQW